MGWDDGISVDLKKVIFIEIADGQDSRWEVGWGKRSREEICGDTDG